MSEQTTASKDSAGVDLGTLTDHIPPYRDPTRGAAILFEGLLRELRLAHLEGRTDQWRRCGHSIIDLLGAPSY